MAYFGRTPKKPGSVPGAASGGKQARAAGTLGHVARVVSAGRQQRSGRTDRQARAAVPARAARGGRSAR